MKEYKEKIRKLKVILDGIQVTLDGHRKDVFKSGRYVGFEYQRNALVNSKLKQRKKIQRKIRKLERNI